MIPHGSHREFQSRDAPSSCPKLRPRDWTFPCPQQPAIGHRLTHGRGSPWEGHVPLAVAVPRRATALSLDNQVLALGMGVSPRGTVLDGGTTVYPIPDRLLRMKSSKLNGHWE